MSNKTTVFLLDNVDSFTYNLVDELRTLDLDIVVYRNTVSPELLLDKMVEKAQTHPVLLLLSPGPGAPEDAGCMPALLKLVQGQFPVLGICLGHQAIVSHYGGVVGKAPLVMHGKSSPVHHDGTGIFANIQQPLHVARYHSLAATTLPACLSILAKTDDATMAVYHSEDKMLGFQFHPESILTEYGSQLLIQSIDYLTRGENGHE